VKRTIIGLVAALLALAAIGAGTALATKPPHPPHPGTAGNGKKIWICHKTHSVKHPYTAVQIPSKQLMNHTGHATHPGDIVNATVTATSPVPQTRKAARAYCKSLAPLTAVKGGHQTKGTLTPATGATVSGSDLSVRLRLGQGQICIAATITSTTTPASPVTVTGISLTQGTTMITLSGFTSALPTNATSPVSFATCATLDRAVVKSILKGTVTTLTIITSAGNLTATLGA
jgi:hypothetical protein